MEIIRFVNGIRVDAAIAPAVIVSDTLARIVKASAAYAGKNEAACCIKRQSA